MRTKLFLSAAVAFGLVVSDPAICAQTTPLPDGSQATGETEDPANPNPMPDPSDPMPPVTEPLPPEMPMPAGEAQQMPPAQPMMQNTDMPMGPMATPPNSGQNSAMSGGTTRAMMMPQPSTKEYPPCTRTLQDNCTNPGERARKPR